MCLFFSLHWSRRSASQSPILQPPNFVQKLTVSFIWIGSMWKLFYWHWLSIGFCIYCRAIFVIRPIENANFSDFLPRLRLRVFFFHSSWFWWLFCGECSVDRKKNDDNNNDKIYIMCKSFCVAVWPNAQSPSILLPLTKVSVIHYSLFLFEW